MKEYEYRWCELASRWADLVDLTNHQEKRIVRMLLGFSLVGDACTAIAMHLGDPTWVIPTAISALMIHRAWKDVQENKRDRAYWLQRRQSCLEMRDIIRKVNETESGWSD